MKKLLLALLFLVNVSLHADIVEPHSSICYKYDEIPEWTYKYVPFFTAMMVTVLYACEFTDYSFEVFDYDDQDKIILVAHHEGCALFVELDRSVGKCEIEVRGGNRNFDYCHFKALIDHFFSYTR